MTRYNPVELPSLTRIDSPTGRKYLTPEGKHYPSVTTVFSVLPNDHIDAWRKRVGEDEANRVSKRATTRGTYIHEQAEYLLKGIPAPKNTTSAMLHGDMWRSFKPIVDQIEEVYALEAMLYSDFLRVAGTVDCVGLWEGKRSIIDFKTSARKKAKEDIPTYFQQTAAYAVMWYELTKQPIHQLVILMAVEDDSPLVFIDKTKNWVQSFIEVRDKYEKQ